MFIISLIFYIFTTLFLLNKLTINYFNIITCLWYTIADINIKVNNNQQNIKKIIVADWFKVLN